jgi:hypothetical protein
MDRTVTLDEPHFKLIADQAAALGKTPAQYLELLIDAAHQTFDEILAPARAGFDAMTDDDVDALFARARRAANQSEE